MKHYYAALNDKDKTTYGYPQEKKLAPFMITLLQFMINIQQRMAN